MSEEPMERIWKYELQLEDIQPVNMPKNAEVLSVMNQNGSPCMWIKVDLKQGRETRQFEVIGTGNPIPQDGAERAFIGTTVCDPFVWHVFERVEAEMT